MTTTTARARRRVEDLHEGDLVQDSAGTPWRVTAPPQLVRQADGPNGHDVFALQLSYRGTVRLRVLPGSYFERTDWLERGTLVPWLGVELGDEGGARR